MAGEAQEARRMFLTRMDNEGRRKEYEKRLAEYMSETGKRWSDASWAVMREFGYGGLAREKFLLEQSSKGGLDPRDFGTVVASLPVQTPKGVSAFDWIAAHPAMKRLDETKRRVELTVEDVLDSPSGPAPSQAAVSALSQYANAPDLFWKKWIEVQATLEKKVVADSAQEAEDEGVVDVERMLNEVKSRVKKEVVKDGGLDSARPQDV